MSLKTFTFFVRNDRTLEIATFKGQGETLDEAAKDAIATINAPFRPNSSGGRNEYTHADVRLNVRLPSGETVARLKVEFQGDAPYQAPAGEASP